MRILKYFDFYSNEENMEVSFIYREMLHNKKEKKTKLINQPNTLLYRDSQELITTLIFFPYIA